MDNRVDDWNAEYIKFRQELFRVCSEREHVEDVLRAVAWVSSRRKRTTLEAR
jgi:hypothetical protein